MTTPGDPLRQYLDQLKASLRRTEASLVLAEAEDHLRESVAAGLRAGLTEFEAHEAAISSFGSVRAVARAHQSRRSRAAAALTDLTMATWNLTWLWLLAYDVSTMVIYAYLKMSMQGSAMPAAPSAGGALPVVSIGLGIAGLPLFAGYQLARRFQRRRGRAVTTRFAGFSPLVAASIFGAASMGLFLLKISGAAPVNRPLILASLVLAAGYAVRMRRAPQSQGRTA
jgi:hypothetical protein